MRPFVGIVNALLVSTAAAGSFVPAERYRQPAAAAVSAGRVYVANRSGSVSTVDPGGRQVIAETAVGGRLSDIAVFGDSLLATDEQRHRLVVLTIADGAVAVSARLPVPHTPVDLAVSSDARRAAVASLWARRVAVIEPGADSQPAFRRMIDLPFAPRKQVFLDGKQLVVADSFGGSLAVIDAAAGRVTRVVRIPGHNIRGLAVASGGKQLLISHQIINGEKSTTQDHVFWGGVMLNVVREISIAELLAARSGALLEGTFHPLGRPGSATGDPHEIAVTKKGQTVVALSGVHQLAVRTEPTQPFLRIDAGRRPLALASDSDGRTVYAVNSFDDSITVVDAASSRVTATIRLGPVPGLNRTQRGERLFFDAKLALDGWMSCHSCHSDGHTSGRNSDNLGDGHFGAPKRILSLLGTVDTRPWAWNAATDSLERQIDKSVSRTMRGEKPTARTIDDLTAYLESLEPPPSLAEARGDLDRPKFERGRKVFVERGCADCHSGFVYTSGSTFDVGFADARGTRNFNPPSLRGVSQRDRFMHDGRAQHLREMLTKHLHGIDGKLSPAEIRDLLEFLRGI